MPSSRVMTLRGAAYMTRVLRCPRCHFSTPQYPTSYPSSLLVSMWLLSTSRATLKAFVSPESVPKPGFAILSHVWGDDEQSFQDVVNIGKRCETSNKNPREHVCSKIRKTCELVEKHGFDWVWIDTCCIDKTSSAELSEAINSMFRYYSLSAVCFVYLQDVYTPTLSNSLRDPVSQFQNSRWHRRGWTLQELLAPPFVILLSSSWILLGSKADLANELEQATHIPASLLRLECTIGEFSLAQRMSWAATRETTRLEDEAYCLLGIFNINMPTLYGEGRKAFQRLQVEIMRQNQDTSLFAWGHIVSFKEVQWMTPFPSFLADSPAAFEHSGQIVYIPQDHMQHVSSCRGLDEQAILIIHLQLAVVS